MKDTCRNGTQLKSKYDKQTPVGSLFTVGDICPVAARLPISTPTTWTRRRAQQPGQTTHTNRSCLSFCLEPHPIAAVRRVLSDFSNLPSETCVECGATYFPPFEYRNCALSVPNQLSLGDSLEATPPPGIASDSSTAGNDGEVLWRMAIVQHRGIVHIVGAWEEQVACRKHAHCYGDGAACLLVARFSICDCSKDGVECKIPHFQPTAFSD